ncbi:MlaE family ABC transporter permease [Calditrichota bacterium GD2]
MRVSSIIENLHSLFVKSLFFAFFAEVRRRLKFAFRVLSSMGAVFRYRHETLYQFYVMGVQALFLVILATSFTSMVMSFEYGKKLEPFGAKLLLGRIMGISIIREIGPIVTGLMIAGRTGAKIVSEIGNMVLSQQTDALRAFGLDPVKRIIVPRVFASIMVMIPLTVLADSVGIIAGWFAAVRWIGLDSEFFWLSLRGGLLVKDLTIGLIKPPFYGLIIGLISSYYGYTIRGGAAGMGRAATQTVVFASVGVLFIDFLLTRIILSLY